MGFTTDADDWQVLCISILVLASVWLHSFSFLISTVRQRTSRLAFGYGPVKNPGRIAITDSLIYG